MADRAQRAMAGVGARSMTGHTRHGARWLPWLALLLLAIAVALVAWMVLRDDDDAGSYIRTPVVWSHARDEPVPV
ncbi:MAG TPA: hypothetical protein VIL36_04960 [Acidimicrobiales bacterium]